MWRHKKWRSIKNFRVKAKRAAKLAGVKVVANAICLTPAMAGQGEVGGRDGCCVLDWVDGVSDTRIDRQGAQSVASFEHKNRERVHKTRQG